MKNYIITYQIRNPWEYYGDFYDAIKKNYPEYQHALEESWFIKTDDEPQKIIDNIKSYLKKNDSVFVVEITDKYAGWMPKSLWKWLKLENGYESLGNTE